MLTTSFVNIACTIINLLILYFIAKKFLFQRIDNIFMQRKEEVDEATKAADKATQEAINTKREYEKKIELADEEKEQILSDIKKQGYDEYERIINDAKKKGEQILIEAKHNAEVENERAKEVYAAQLTDMVIDAASKIAATKHSTQDDLELYDKFISEAGVSNE
ncbi:F-type H+-transporting ATPase subunit b [Butyrivibrio hungatei DSM 14810]|uniref:ATP synthase subunit b n=1 Tax=Butyrivibrio hungatei DSM 14810 TaxID=1121132 RepID=A0A1M7SBX0_9FIRM|nr:ATP synthase F0 subunit B [Butyrivibrio hungatei]SHN55732.1 F-type H+-transporting ATPase subunit b [Butyrivibrio hungatei DSM 14810]